MGNKIDRIMSILQTSLGAFFIILFIIMLAEQINNSIVGVSAFLGAILTFNGIRGMLKYRIGRA